MRTECVRILRFNKALLSAQHKMGTTPLTFLEYILRAPSMQIRHVYSVHQSDCGIIKNQVTFY